MAAAAIETPNRNRKAGADEDSTKTTMKHGEGLRQYYQQHIHDLQLLVRHKANNLNRLEAQRNDLNSKGTLTLTLLHGSFNSFVHDLIRYLLIS